jgi:hypothetical protein
MGGFVFRNFGDLIDNFEWAPGSIVGDRFVILRLRLYSSQ